VTGDLVGSILSAGQQPIALRRPLRLVGRIGGHLGFRPLAHPPGSAAGRRQVYMTERATRGAVDRRA
jgi:hypothetical protein